MTENTKQVLLVILDGWGHREEEKDNAIAEARTPFFDHLYTTYPHSLLGAHGRYVGLPDGQSGNSEVGHIAIGTGQIIHTDLVRITKAFEDGTIMDNQTLRDLFTHVTANSSTLHLLGLLSPGGVHSHQKHLHGMLRVAKEAGITKIAIHAFTDGRDTPPQSARGYLEELEQILEEEGVGYIASAAGRFWAMDRDHNWDRVSRAEDALFAGKGSIHQNAKASEVMHALHEKGIMDEHLEPMVFLDEKGSSYTIQKNDGVLFFNFRPDRARMLARRISLRAEKENLYFATMTGYDATLPAHVLFPQPSVETSIAHSVSNAGLSQAHIAETEKYAHVTYFLNGGKEVRYANEEDILIPSRKDILTHDLAPDMRAKEITDAAILQIKKGVNFIVINYANSDMVAHTANKDATLHAIETIDTEMKRLVENAKEMGAIVFITSDHGNAEVTIDQQTGVKHTAHTTNPVPAILTLPSVALSDGGLADVAPTILELLDIIPPTAMNGRSLIVQHLKDKKQR